MMPSLDIMASEFTNNRYLANLEYLLEHVIQIYKYFNIYT